jgi:DNA-binding response OmpR family regulator
MFPDGHDLINYLSDFNNAVPQFLFLDLHMPKKSGFQCLDAIRADERLNQLHVIIYSTSAHLEHINEALNRGANLYFAKSSTFQELVNRLIRIFDMNWTDFNPGRTIEKFVIADEMQF